MLLSSSVYGLLVMLIPGIVVLMALLYVKPGAAMSIAINKTDAADLFELPVRIDDTEELLEQYGNFMLGNINRSIDPCENFYDYACGNWKESEAVPEFARNDSFLHTIQVKLNGLTKNFLENATDIELRNETTRAEVKAKQFYHSCLEANMDMARGYQDFNASIDDRYEGERKNETQDWIYINFMSQYEMFPLLPLKVHYNTEMRKFDISIAPPKVVLGDKKLVDVKNLTRDFKIEDEEKFESEFNNLVSFEKNLTALATKKNTTEVLNIGEFLKGHVGDKLNWTRFFEVAFNGTQRDEWYVLNSIDNVDKLVRFLEKSELPTLRSYVKWRVLIKFYYSWKTETTDKELSSACRQHTEEYFNYALLPWFIEQIFDSDQRADILTIGKHIKETFYDKLEHYTWLDEETKSEAKTKLSSMDFVVGYSDDMQHRDVIDKIYGEVNMTMDWFKNLAFVERNRARIRMRSINKAFIPSLMSTRSVNAYYADFLNLVHITIGMAQWPFYHKNFPASLKYGGIGNIIGHEMAHGFDSYCYQFNYDGKKQNWWTEASLRNFRERYRCLESQYNKYILLGVQTNGNHTSGDNIADNVGLRMAYYAYMGSGGGKEEAKRKSIPGLEFTNQQLYFLKFAQSWCSGKDTAYVVKKLKTDVHAFDEFRVVGTLSNMPEFSEAFKCKLGTDMNPLKKCIVW